jgi:hypothetical protein
MIQLDPSRLATYLAYRISLPMPAFRGLTSKPLRIAFSVGVAYGTPCCSRVNPNKSALPPSVHKSVASAMRVLDTGFDGRGGSSDGDRNLDRSGVVRFLGGVDGRGGGLESLGGSMIFVDFEPCRTGRDGPGGGERTRVGHTVGTFSFGTNASCSKRERRTSFWWIAARRRWSGGTRSSPKGRARARGVCFCLESLGCGRSERIVCERAKSERKLGTRRD